MTATEINEAALALERGQIRQGDGPMQTQAGDEGRVTSGGRKGEADRDVGAPSLGTLLAVVDSPTENTGFAGVAKALLPRWSPHFERIDIWGINYEGWPHGLPWRIFPGGRDWANMGRLEKLLNQILDGGYTHVWVLQDSFMFANNGFAENLRQACNLAGAKLIVYYPVDAPLEKSWLNIARAADVAVTYTEYGAEESRRADARVKPLVIPHGVDTSVFKPLGDEWRVASDVKDVSAQVTRHSSPVTLREQVFGEWAGPDDFVMVNVNRNERRKGMVGCLQVLAELVKTRNAERGTGKADRDVGAPSGFKLFLHTPFRNEPEGVDLKMVGRQLGLTYGQEWLTTPEEMFGGGVGRMTEAQVNLLYNASDLNLTTTLGEGWGLSITEAAAAGLPVVCPDHTSCAEIGRMFDALGRGKQIRLAPLAGSGVVNTKDNSRVRWPVDIAGTAELVEEIASPKAEILAAVQSLRRFPALEGALKEWLSWDRIAAAWVEIFAAVLKPKELRKSREDE